MDVFPVSRQVKVDIIEESWDSLRRKAGIRESNAQARLSSPLVSKDEYLEDVHTNREEEPNIGWANAERE